MAVTNPRTPTVAVSVPIPTPVRQPKPKQASAPVSFPVPLDEGDETAGPAPRPGGTPRAVILPWTPPPPRRMKRKYGRVSRSAVHDFFDQGHANNLYAANNASDGVFADYLEENGDPRHEIVRRDISYRRRDANEFEEYRRHHARGLSEVKSKQYTGPLEIPLKDGTRLQVNPHTLYPGNTVYQLRWDRPVRSGQYRGMFTGDELNNLIPGIRKSDATPHPGDSPPPPTAEKMKRLPRKVVRYMAGDPSHKEFQDKILENVKEKTGHLVYADWLEENNMPVLAAAIRRAVNSPSQGSPGFMFYSHKPRDPDAAKEHNSVFVYQGIGAFRERVGRSKPKPTLQITIKNPYSEEHKGYLAYNLDGPPHEIEQTVKQLLAEGHPAGNSGAEKRR